MNNNDNGNELPKEEKKGFFDKILKGSSEKEGKNPDETFSLEEEKEIIEATDNDDLEGEDITGKYYTVDLALKNDDETEDEFMTRAKEEGLGKWIPLDNEQKTSQEKESETKREETTLELIKRIRLKLDKSLQYTAITLGNRSDVYKSVFKAKAWMGKLLGELGNTNPYITKDPIKNASEIPPTVDVFSDNKKIRNHELRNHLEQVLHLRDLIGDCIDMINIITFTEEEYENLKDQRLAKIAITNSYSKACEARFELGYELSVIREK